MGEFTPGPWAYRPQEYDDWGIVRMAGRDEDGFQRVICQANYVADPTELCEHRANGTDPAEANARLIAAAPELLAAAQIAFETLAPWKDDDFVWAAMSQLMNAIHKAAPPEAP